MYRPVPAGGLSGCHIGDFESFQRSVSEKEGNDVGREQALLGIGADIFNERRTPMTQSRVLGGTAPLLRV